MCEKRVCFAFASLHLPSKVIVNSCLAVCNILHASVIRFRVLIRYLWNIIFQGTWQVEKYIFHLDSLPTCNMLTWKMAPTSPRQGDATTDLLLAHCKEPSPCGSTCTTTWRLSCSWVTSLMASTYAETEKMLLQLP